MGELHVATLGDLICSRQSREPAGFSMYAYALAKVGSGGSEGKIQLAREINLS